MSSRNRGNKWQETSGKMLLSWMPALAYMALIFVLSSFPAPEPVRQVPIIYDIKIVHIIEYGVLSVLIAYALLRTTKMSLLQVSGLAITLTVLYGISDEIHQAFVPQRSSKVTDVIGDLVGAVLFQLAIIKFGIASKFRSRG